MSSTQSAQVHGAPDDHVTRDTLRRGHSESDVLESRPNERRRTSTDTHLGGRETWTDFLRDAPGDRQDIANRVQLAAGRAAVMAADRRKRLTERQEDYSRRRSSSNLSFLHSPNGRLRQNSTLNEGQRPPPPNNTNSLSTQRITDRALPQTPSARSSHDWRSQDISLPSWQRDAEVSKCPICGMAFTFWYRKHHCRKCGRVVCGNCSPHRITIPRQFIVHPPEEITTSPTIARTTGIEVVDLTDDHESGGDSPDLGQRPQSSDYRIDPSLGGGQEVRLCNPCVPDPNPLPHLPFSPPHGSSCVPFERPLPESLHHQRSSISDLTASERDGPTTLVRQTASDHLNIRQESLPRFDGSMQSRETFGFPDTGTSSNRPNHHRFARPANPSIPPPGYSTMYGSAPDQSGRQVGQNMKTLLLETDRSKRELAALLQDRAAHRHHRHHASMGTFPSLSRYRPEPGHDMPTQRPPPHRPQLREEDECPICHQALPPKGPDNSEVVREAHVQSCIETHFSTSGPRVFNPPPPPSAATEAAVVASALTPNQRVPAGRRTSADTSDIASSSQQRRRVAGMLTYQANEKDCVGEDGEGGQECVICFEEYAVGDEMGRLECLCKFHKVSICLCF